MNHDDNNNVGDGNNNNNNNVGDGNSNNVGDGNNNNNNDGDNGDNGISVYNQQDYQWLLNGRMPANLRSLFIDVLLPRKFVRDELDASQVLGRRLEDALYSIVPITDANKCGFHASSDPHGFVYGGQLIIGSSNEMAEDLAYFFVKNVTEPQQRALCCPHDNNGCRSFGFRTWMDVEHHVSNNCFGTDSMALPPIHERNCNFQNIGWCIKDRYVRMLRKTNFGALGLPPQDLIDSNRKPYVYQTPNDVKYAEYAAIVNERSTLLTAANYVCNNQDITTKEIFLAGLGLFKNLDLWSPGLLGKLQVRKRNIKDNWPETVKLNIGILKTAADRTKERNQAKKLKRAEERDAKVAAKKADLKRMRASELERESKKAASLKSPPGQDI